MVHGLLLPARLTFNCTLHLNKHARKAAARFYSIFHDNFPHPCRALLGRMEYGCEFHGLSDIITTAIATFPPSLRAGWSRLRFILLSGDYFHLYTSHKRIHGNREHLVA